MFEELAGHVFVSGIVGKFKGHRKHGGAEEGHPRGSVGLLHLAPARQRFGAVEHPDVVEPQETTGKDGFAGDVLTIDPPGEGKQELLEDAREEHLIAAASRAADLVGAPAGPRVHRRIGIAEGELVSRQLPVGCAYTIRAA